MINGNGSNPQIEDLLAVAQKAALPKKWSKDTAMEIQELTQNYLGIYLRK